MSSTGFVQLVNQRPRVQLLGELLRDGAVELLGNHEDICAFYSDLLRASPTFTLRCSSATPRPMPPVGTSWVSGEGSRPLDDVLT